MHHYFIRMGIISGLGWLLDAAVYMNFAIATGHVFAANILGNCCGILFSFVFGSKYAFGYQGKFPYKKLAMYALFAGAMIPLFSALILSLVQSGLLGLLAAKIIVTIPSFIANYLFIKFLLH
jgi:putative flippase GtrA